MPAYSFKEVLAAINGPGGSINIGAGAGVEEGGITIEPTRARGVMSEGADGEVMHGLDAANSGRVRVRLLKTSQTNALLMDMLNFQRVTPANWGDNTITLTDRYRGDVYTCRECAFEGEPGITWARNPNMNEWVFLVGHIDPNLGKGRPVDVAVTA